MHGTGIKIEKLSADRTESPQIGPNIYGQLIFGKGIQA